MTPNTASAILKSFEPSLIPLNENLVAAVFPLMKIYPAEFCLRRAIADGLVRESTMVVESSSGTLALGLAIVCVAFGFVGVMMVLATISKSAGGAAGLGRGVMLVMAMIGGGSIPLFLMPAWMKAATISMMVPPAISQTGI